MAEARKVPLSVIDAERKAAVPAGRFGTPRSSAPPSRSCARQHAGFITGQNLLIDGGGFPGSL